LHEETREATKRRRENAELKEKGLLIVEKQNQAKRKKSDQKKLTAVAPKHTLLRGLTSAMPHLPFPCEFSLDQTWATRSVTSGLSNSFNGDCSQICYANAVVQGIAPILDCWASITTEEELSGVLDFELAAVLVGLRTEEKSLFHLLLRISPRFKPGIQQDAGEFFGKLMETLQDVEVPRQFAFQHCCLYRCNKCNRTRYPEESADAARSRLSQLGYLLKLTITEADTPVTLAHCFELTLQSDPDAEFGCRYGCPRISARGSATATHFLRFKGPFVMVQLNRFRFLPEGKLKRLNTPIEFHERESFNYKSDERTKVVEELQLVAVVHHLLMGITFCHVKRTNNCYNTTTP